MNIDKKIISIDLDGTLLNEEKIVPESTKEYFRKLRKQGHIIMINTGRYYAAAIDVLGKLDYIDYVACNAGGLLYDVKKDKNKIYAEFSYDIVKDIFYKTKKYDIKSLNIATDKSIYSYDKMLNSSPHGVKNVIRYNDIEELLEEKIDIIHMSVVLKSYDETVKYFNENNKLEGYNMYIMKDSNSHVSWIEIRKNNIDKYAIISEVSKIHDIPEKNSISFGDSINDLEMIQNTGIGVAMGNAIEDIKLNSDSVTSSNDEKGVEMWLKNYFKN